MFVEYKFKVGISDLTPKMELSNTAILRYLENLGNMHSEIAGYGVTDMDRTRVSWILLSWKVKVIKRSKINDELNVKTWSAGIDRYFAFRDFEVTDQYGDIVCIATSAWSMINIDTGKICKMDDEISRKYTQEDKHIFDNEMKREKIAVPEDFESSGRFKITRSMIDLNKHLHNVYYYDIAREALPEDIVFEQEFDEFEILYKKEIKLEEEVEYYYTQKDGYHYVVIKNSEGIVSSIMRMK